MNTSAPALVTLLSLLALASHTASQAQDTAARGHIRNMAGCYDVTYYFHEDGTHDYFSDEKPPAIENEEFLAVTRDEPDGIVIQHATISPEGQAIPHWHEVWTRGPGGWTQSVYGRTPGAEERELRYRCTAPWSMNRWECDIGPAPKPFRDNGAPFGWYREDYDHLHRKHTILVTPQGWVQSERNRKLTEDGELVSHELGYIIYRKWGDDRCEEAVTDRSLLERAD